MMSLASTIEPFDTPAADRNGRNILLFAVLLTIIFLPEELSFYFGTMRLTVARAALILAAPVVFIMFAKQTVEGHLRLSISDVLVGLSGMWMLVASAVIQGWDKALVSSGVLVLEFCLPYVTMRVLVRRNIDIEAAIQVFCVVTGTVALVAILDSLFGYHVVHEASARLTGYLKPGPPPDFRMGFLRASGPMEHPILFGTVCALALVLSAPVRFRLRWFVRASCIAGLFFSFSSGAVGGLLVGLLFVVYDRTFAHVRARWSLFAILLVPAVGLVFLISKAPLNFILSNMTFDPQSAFFRLLIWQYGGAALMQSPIFGIGVDAQWLREDWMPKSVDSFYLMSALNFGIPGSFFMAMSWLSPVLFPGARTTEDDTIDPDRVGRLKSALNAVLVVVMYVGCTVHFWGVSWMLISVLAGLRASLNAQPGPVDEPALVRQELIVLQRGLCDSNLPASSR